jgi:hypothetical protein
MIVGVATLATVSVAQFRGFTRGDLKRAMEAGAVA